MLNKNTLRTKALEATAVGATLLRLVVANNMAKKVEAKQSFLKPLAIFLAADVLDGVLSRKMGVDTPLRRFADAAVDRLSIARVGIAMGKVNKTAQRHLLVLGAKEAITSAANGLHYLRTGEIVQGYGIHKLGSISVAAFGIAASTYNEVATEITGTVMNCVNAALAVDYISNAIELHGDVDSGVRRINFNS